MLAIVVLMNEGVNWVGGEEMLTIATITMNDGMKWSSNPAPGAPLGQLDAQNLPKLEKLMSDLKLLRSSMYKSRSGYTYGKTPSFASS